ncbi:MAG: DUF3570 domain-containing protein [Polyangiaceae bacterium]|nr:DUF3570 domain-containing protein [Polyangiaceae bacterium]
MPAAVGEPHRGARATPPAGTSPRATWSAAGAGLLVLVTACAGRPSAEVIAAQSIYVRTDSDATTVVSPRTRVSGKVGDAVSVDAAYAVDVWTGASIDVVTAATRPIEEQRHEIQAGAGYERDAATLTGSYRYSVEPDYESHGGVLRGALDLFRKNTTLALTVFGSRDTVGRAGDPWFKQPQWSLGGRFAVTQVLSRSAIAELSWETSTIQGYQASPYRWVAIGGQGICAGGAPFCVPEQVPDERYRHAATALGRMAGPGGVSLGAKYRFYFDSWGLASHAIEPDIAIDITKDGVLSLRYRYYTQGEASFYRPRYFELAPLEYVTRDRKLSALHTHALGIAFAQDFPCARSACTLGLQATGTYFTYLAFVGLEHVRALELTALFGVNLDVPRDFLSPGRAAALP